MNADAPLTDDERAELEPWDREGVYACPHTSHCATPVACREKFGLVAAVGSILTARETALRETIAQAWDEGYDTCHITDSYWAEFPDGHTPNPYRGQA